MTPFERPATLRIISTSAAITLLVAVGIFILVLISSATQLSHAAVPATVRGPLGLFELQKQAGPGGSYEASIALLPGAIVYGAFWVIAAAALAWSRLSGDSEDQTSSS